MDNKDVLYKTQLKFVNYFLAIIRAFVFLPIGILFFLLTSELYIFVLLAIFFLFILYMFLYYLHTYKLTKTKLIIERPWFLKNEEFNIEEIERVIFDTDRRSKFGGPYTKIITSNNEQKFMLFTFGDNLRNLATELKRVGIITKNNILEK